VIIGQRGVDLAREIGTTDAEIKVTATRLAELERAMKWAHPVITDVAAFCAFAIPEDIEAQIGSATRALNLARQTAAILQRKSPRLFELVSLATYEDHLESSVAGISQTAAQRVATHIEQHGMAAHGERWIKYGLDHMQGENCPFCSQGIEHIDLVGAFRDFFSEAYSEHTRQIEETGQRLEGTARGDRGRLGSE
jgi:wobble nucleotide-excising tRNase